MRKATAMERVLKVAYRYDSFAAKVKSCQCPLPHHPFVQNVPEHSSKTHPSATEPVFVCESSVFGGIVSKRAKIICLLWATKKKQQKNKNKNISQNNNAKGERFCLPNQHMLSMLEI